MPASDPKSSAATKTVVSLPKYRLEYAEAARNKCKSCAHYITKNELRFGVVGPGRGKDKPATYAWRHWPCVTDSELADVKKEGPLTNVDGYKQLDPKDQTRVTKAYNSGHVVREDKEAQDAKNAAADEESNKSKSKDKQSETDKKEKKKTKKRKETEDREETDTAPQPKKKKTKEGESPNKSAATTVTAKTKPALSPDLVPDSEDEDEDRSEDQIESEEEDDETPLSKTVKKGETSKGKKKESPKKLSEKHGSSSNDDEEMDVDEDDVAPKSKAKSKEKKPPATVKKEDAKTKDLEKVSAAKTAPKAPPKSRIRASAVKKDEKKEDDAAAGVGKAKAASTIPKVDKPVKIVPAVDVSPRPVTNGTFDSHIVALQRQALPTDTSLAYSPRPKPPPRQTLARFCKAYKLSPSLQEKLANIDVDGPHVLRLIQDGKLEALGFSIGEIAGLRDAEQRWLLELEEKEKSGH